MIKIKDQRKNLISTKDMQIGSTGYIQYDGEFHLVYRVFQGLVSLTDPMKTWMMPDDRKTIWPDLLIEIVNIEITVK
jgi:hypothetical protein